MLSEHFTGRGVRFGAAYYSEYQPAGSLDRDLDLMQAAHFNVIRVGESVWSTWEPRNGEFDLDWLQPVLDAAHQRGIDVILGTPTYAVPPWLAHAYPEIAGEPATGRPMPWGSRQEIDVTHPGFLFHAERVIRKIVGRYAAHPAVIGYQVDNEPGAMLLHNRGTFTAFVEWLKRRYGSVEALNREWGLVYWSHRLSDWSELWRPDGNTQPQYGLAWRQFQAEATARFIHWQAELVREYATADQFVTTCVSYDRPSADEWAISSGLDVAAANPYYGMQDHLDLTMRLKRPDAWIRTGVPGLLELADRGYAMRQARYLVTETNAAAIHQGWQNFPPYPGQMAQAAFALVARGAAMIEYWHWHTLHFGAETYWGGVLPHSQVPGRIYREVAELGSAFETLGDRLNGYEPDYDLTVLFSNSSKYAMETHPHLCDELGKPRPGGYLDVITAWEGAAMRSGRQVRILHDHQLDALDVETLVARHPVLVVMDFFTASTEQLEKLRDYSEMGGHLIAGVRTGYGDHEGRARLAMAPDVIRTAAGVSYEEFANLTDDLSITTDALLLPEGARAQLWAEGVVADGSEVLARYDHPYLQRFAAATTKPTRKGRCTYVGTVPNQELGAAILDAVLHEPIHGPWNVGGTATVFSGTTASEQVFFIHNWSGEPTSLRSPFALEDVLTGAHVDAEDVIPLPAWSVRVLGRPLDVPRGTRRLAQRAG